MSPSRCLIGMVTYIHKVPPRARFIFGNFISQFGSWFYLMAMQWLLNDSRLITLNSALASLTTVFAGLLLAKVSDDADAQWQAKCGNLLLAIISFIIGILIMNGITLPVVLIAMNVLSSAITVFKNPAEDAVFKFAGEEAGSYSDLIKKLTTRYLARVLVGIGIAALTTIVGVAGLFWFDAVSFLVMLAVISSLTVVTPSKRQSAITFREQWEHAKSQPGFLLMLLLIAIQNGAGFVIFALLPELTKDVRVYGMMMAFGGAGSVLSGYLTRILVIRYPQRGFELYCISGIFGTVPLAVAFLTNSTDWLTLAFCYFIANVLGTISVYQTDYRCQQDTKIILAYRLHSVAVFGVANVIRLVIAFTMLPVLGVRLTIGLFALVATIFTAVILGAYRRTLAREFSSSVISFGR